MQLMLVLRESVTFTYISVEHAIEPDLAVPTLVLHVYNNGSGNKTQDLATKLEVFCLLVYLISNALLALNRFQFLYKVKLSLMSL